MVILFQPDVDGQKSSYQDQSSYAYTKNNGVEAVSQSKTKANARKMIKHHDIKRRKVTTQYEIGD
jgi:hypothetical protein